MTCAAARILDAGCGTGALAVEAAKRGADVTAVDISPTLIGIARERLPEKLGDGRIHFIAGDMLDKQLGTFDHVVAMDSLIHYSLPDMVEMLSRLSEMSTRRHSLHLCAADPCPCRHAHGGQDLSAQRPLAPHRAACDGRALQGDLARPRASRDWRLGRNARVSSGFYISHAQELKRA